MNNPLQDLLQDIKTAMKAGDKSRLESLRYLHSKLKNAQIDKGKDSVLSAAEAQKVIAKLVKQSQEAIEQYRQGGREDLVADENRNVEIWQEYLPEQVSSEEILAVIEKLRASNPGIEPGPLTGLVIKELKGQADGGIIAKLIRQN